MNTSCVSKYFDPLVLLIMLVFFSFTLRFILVTSISGKNRRMLDYYNFIMVAKNIWYNMICYKFYSQISKMCNLIQVAVLFSEFKVLYFFMIMHPMLWSILVVRSTKVGTLLFFLGYLLYFTLLELPTFLSWLITRNCMASFTYIRYSFSLKMHSIFVSLDMIVIIVLVI